VAIFDLLLELRMICATILNTLVAL
jgi:hypothetical protein